MGRQALPPREEDKRDSGLLYYFTGPDKVWPRALELQIQETDVGDLWILEGSRISTKIETEGYPMYVLSGPLRTQSRGRIIKFGDFEDRDGWNTVEAVLDGDRITHLVNGRAVMRAWTSSRHLWTTRPSTSRSPAAASCSRRKAPRSGSATSK